MKLNYLSAGVLLTALSFSSCSNEDTPKEINSGAVRFNASITSQTRIDAWGGESVGLYMLDNDADFSPIVENKEYTVSANGDLTAKNGTDIYYPTDGSEVKFTAYYPYTQLTEHKYKVDLSDASVEDHDLIYATSGRSYNQEQNETVNLAFAHQLAKLSLSLQDAEGTSIVDFTATINRPVKADFDLKDASLAVNEASVAKLNMAISSSTASALVVPGSYGSIAFVYEGKSYTWDMSEIEMLSGKNMSFTLKLIETEEPENQVDVVGMATIEGWDEVPGGEIDLNEDTDEGDNEGGDDTTVNPFTSNIALPTNPTAAVQTNAYGGIIKIDGVEYSCLKLGTGSNAGKFETAVIGAGKTKVTFYAYAWTNTTSILTVSTSEDNTMDFTLESNTGASGSSPYSIANPANGYIAYTFDLQNVTEETTLTFETSGSGKRAIIFGVNVE